MSRAHPMASVSALLALGAVVCSACTSTHEETGATIRWNGTSAAEEWVATGNGDRVELSGLRYPETRSGAPIVRFHGTLERLPDGSLDATFDTPRWHFHKGPGKRAITEGPPPAVLAAIVGALADLPTAAAGKEVAHATLSPRDQTQLVTPAQELVKCTTGLVRVIDTLIATSAAVVHEGLCALREKQVELGAAAQTCPAAEEEKRSYCVEGTNDRWWDKDIAEMRANPMYALMMAGPYGTCVADFGERPTTSNCQPKFDCDPSSDDRMKSWVEDPSCIGCEYPDKTQTNYRCAQPADCVDRLKGHIRDGKCTEPTLLVKPPEDRADEKK